jgi:steroid delta-isomerase-like uncharacterized protein
MRTETIAMSTEMTAAEEVVLTTLASLNDGKIAEAVANFAEDFTFNDRGIGLDFQDQERLAEFFRKMRELYQDTVVQTDRISVKGDRVIVEWTLHATLTEPFFGGLTRRVPISLQGVSVVQTHNGRIAVWADYYDGLASRRTALASYFTEWIEL